MTTNSIHLFILFCSLYQGVYGAITSLSQTTKPNAGQPVHLVCDATDTPSVPGPNALTLTRSDGSEVTASETTVVDTNRRVTTFIVTVVDLGTEFTCSLLDSDGTTVLDRQTITVDVYVLPFLQSPPTIVLDYTISTELTVNWLPWETDGRGDGPILRYEVVYRNKSDVEGDTSYDYILGMDSDQTTMARVTGLRTEQEYDFAVVVVREGEGGAGMPSNKSTITTRCAGSPTSAPIVDSLTAIGPTELQLVWMLPPPSTWGCRKTPSLSMSLKESSEDFYRFPVDIETADPSGIFNITNLLSCTTYDVQLYFYTSIGFSPASEVINGSTLRTVPPRVILFRLDSARDGVGLFAQWSPPEGTARHCHIGTYYVRYTLLRLEACDTDVMSPTTEVKGIFDDSTSTTLDNLIPYATYNVSVVSSNELGRSTDSSYRTWTTIPTFATVLPPVQVTDVTARSITFSWERLPCEELHGDFTSYRYTVTNNKTGEQYSNNIGDIDVTVMTLEYLTACSPYDIQMTLLNNRGVGDRSENVRVTTDTEVAQDFLNVVASSVDKNPSELNLTWEEPLSSCPIEYYRVSYELIEKYKCETVDAVVRIVAGNATQLSYTIVDLLPYSRYFVYVESFTEGAGFGRPTRDVRDTAERVPTVAPDQVAVGDVLRRELSFSCRYPECTVAGRSSRILGFTYNLTDLVNPGNPSIVIEGESTYQVFDGLVPNTRYSLRVRLRTNAGDGPYSEPIEATTLEDRPGPPSNVSINEIKETMMTVTWEVPSEPNGNITGYKVQYRATEKPYDPFFTSPSSWVEFPLLGPSVLSNIFTQLEPSTKYQILLWAWTLVGRGEYASVDAFTKPKTDIPKPAPPTVDTSTSTATTVAISLPNEDDTYVTSYLIAVKKTSNKRAAVDIEGESFGTYNDNPNAYIAAEISKRDKADIFVVGDGEMYGNYLNAPLVTGTTYNIRTGSASETDTASTVSWSEPLVAEARSYGSSPKPPATVGPNTDTPPVAGDDNVGIIVAVVIVVILLLVVAGFAVLFYWRKKRNAQEPADPVDDTQMKEREVGICV